MTERASLRRATPVNPASLSAEDFAAIAQIVEEVRTGEGSGGQCGFVAEVLARRYGWDILGGVYHAEDGHPVGDHVWNCDPVTGLRVDATADQFGEGAEVRVFAEGDATGRRYRHAEDEEQEEAWLGAARARRDADGDYWWLPDGDATPAAAAYEARVARWWSGTQRSD